MRWIPLVPLFGTLALLACGNDGEAPRPPAGPPRPPAEAEKSAETEPGAPVADIRAEILSALAAHPAGLVVDSTDGRAVLNRFRPADCLDSADMEGMPFQRICAWWSRPQAERGADISVIIDGGMVLGAVVRASEGVQGWDCQPAAAPPGYAICMATRVSSAQSEGWSGYWNDLARR